MQSLRTALLPTALFVCANAGFGQWVANNPVTSIDQQTDGALIKLQSGALRLIVCTDSILRVTYSPTGTFSNRPEYVVTKTAWPKTDFTVDRSEKGVTLTTGQIKAAIDRASGALTFTDTKGALLIEERTRIATPVRANGENAYRVESVFPIYGSTEGLYGLGQHQAGVWNYRGADVDLSQENTEIAVPMLVSTKGFGIFWNSTSRTRVNNRFVHTLYISSEFADTIDYYFLYGPEFDKLVAGYRELTGGVPLFGKWAYGFWQSKNRYQSQTELLGIARKYRELHIPIDNIVQDWFWWNHKGEHVFNKNYPDPKGMVEQLHRENYHVMISVWPFFDPGTAVYADMEKRGYLIERTKVGGFHPQGMAIYDATNPDARTYYWNLMDRALFGLGFDAWWLDTNEPETEGREENILLDHRVAIGNGARYANLFPLMSVKAVYDGQRRATDKKRVFLLSRSSFAGSQRYGVTAWSGDVLSTFEAYKRQIPAGLNFVLSGLPYWTTDIGGFFIGNPDDPAYRELFVRWFEYGTFCPIFRVHGTRTTNQNELWSYGADAQRILAAYDRLRYCLLPYIYSLAGRTTREGYTPMRPLVMDFRTDSIAQNIGDQFLLGPALLVSPVTEQGATTRQLYLPKQQWYDFWTGKTVTGGSWLNAPAPLERIPLHVRAGSIIPMGPEVEYAGQKPADPVELRVYPGADANFKLYDDEGDGYAYENGAFATIPLHWDDRGRTLTIGTRTGSYPGMPSTRAFRVIVVREGHGQGIEPTGQAEQVATYSGAPLSLKL